jgi:hypothetical protein
MSRSDRDGVSLGETSGIRQTTFCPTSPSPLRGANNIAANFARGNRSAIHVGSAQVAT